MNTTIDYKEIAKAWDNKKPIGRSCGKLFWLAIRIAIGKQIPKKPMRYGFQPLKIPATKSV